MLFQHKSNVQGMVLKLILATLVKMGYQDDHPRLAIDLLPGVLETIHRRLQEEQSRWVEHPSPPRG